MHMKSFTTSRRYSLFDDGHLIIFDQVPSITALSPRVVLRIRPADRRLPVRHLQTPVNTKIILHIVSTLRFSIKS